MPRMARVVIPDAPHHITQRGNRSEDVFFKDVDRLRYLKLLGEYAAKHDLAIWAYCLMTNHVHLVVVPGQVESLSRTFRPLHHQYAQEVNQRLGLAGHLWQGRFFSCPLDDRHFWTAVRYVERNPVQAGIVEKAEDYRWSSAATHCGMRADTLLSGQLESSDEIADWSAWLRDAGEQDERIVRRLRMCTRTGRPAGDETFLDKLEAITGRILRAKPGGRPKKQPKNNQKS